MKSALGSIALIAAIALITAACGGGEEGLTRAEVEQIVDDAIEEKTQPEPGLTRAEVEEITG